MEKFLPKLIRAVKKEGLNVVWSCDPMHGNTVKSATGFKPDLLITLLRK